MKKPLEREKLQEMGCETRREGWISGTRNFIAKGTGLRHYLICQRRNSLGVSQSAFESLVFDLVAV